MRNFFITSLVLLFFTNHAFSYQCFSREYSENIRFFEINGKRIYTLFNVGLFDESERFNAIVYAPLRPIEPGRFNSVVYSPFNPMINMVELNRLLDEHTEMISFRTSDFQQVASLLDGGLINWIGIGYSRMDLIEINESEVVNYVLTKNELDPLKDFPSWSEEKTNDILYLRFPVETIIQGEYLNIFFDDLQFSAEITIPEERLDISSNGVKDIIPLEDHALSLEALIMERDMDTRWNEIISLDEEKMSQEQKEAFSRLAFDEGHRYNAVTLQEFDVFVRDHGIEDSEVVEMVRGYIDMSSEFLENMSERDDLAVQTALSQNGNGLIIRRVAHQKNVEDKLVQACWESKGVYVE